jgi:transcriptional regulator with XRE-family HTH domain
MSIETSGNIGEKVKDLRRYFGISQKALCQNICSQAYVSRLEKGEINVSADILFLLSRRLGVEISYFFDNYNSPRSEYVTTTIKQIRDAIDKRNYKRADEMVTLELKNPLFSNNLDANQFLLWNKGICSYHLGKGKEQALFYINKALECSITTRKNYSEREIEILLSKAIILQETTRAHEAKAIFEELLKALKKNVYISDPKIHVRSYFNYQRLLIHLEEHKEAIRIGKLGIAFAKDSDLMYLQGEIYYQEARCYRRLGELSKAYESLKKATYCFTLNDDVELYEYAMEFINELEEEQVM